PLVAGGSQGSAGCENGQGGVHRSAQGTASAHTGLWQPQTQSQVLDADHGGVLDSLDSCPNTAVGTTVDPSGCAVQTTPQPPPLCVNSGSAGGTASIDGQVFVDASPWPGLRDWCVQLSGPVSATAVTDASGNYLF